MIIQCPSCQTKYKIAASKVQPGRSKVRCSRCGHEFVAVAAGGEPVEKKEASSQPEQFEQPEAVESVPYKGGIFEEFEETPADGEMPEAGTPKSLFGRLLLLLLILLVFAAAGTVGSIYYPQIRSMLPFFQEPAEQQTSLTRKSMVEKGNVEDIALMDVRQYMVQNDKIGRILVIEGKAVNQSEFPKKLIKLRAVLYNTQGKALREKEFLCGNTVSLFQLQVLNRSELESALNSKVGVLTNNSNLGPGQEVEFMTVFTAPDKGLTEFSLKVVKAANASPGE